MTLAVLIPLYNEQNTIVKLLEKVNSVQLPNSISKEIIIVDDCSSDNSVQMVISHIEENGIKNIKLIQHLKNKGKGAAIRTAIENATSDYIVIQDADLEYNPEEYEILLRPIIEGYADAVYGSRFMGGKPHRILFFWHTIGNKFLTFLSNMFTNLNLTDMETCYKMFDASVLKSIPLKENRFGFEPEVTAKIAKIKNIRIYEVGISYYGRTYEEGKKINWKDGFYAIYCIFKYALFK